jgi:hypothetical protein
MQILLALLGLLFGVALSGRHNAYILIPTSVAAAAIASAISFAAHDSSLGIALTAILTITTLQIGYLAGAIFSGTASRQNIAGAPNVPIENTLGRAEVVYFQRPVAKTP